MKQLLTSNMLSLFISIFSVTGSIMDKAVSSSIPNMQENISQLLRLQESGFSMLYGRYFKTVVLYNFKFQVTEYKNMYTRCCNKDTNTLYVAHYNGMRKNL